MCQWDFPVDEPVSLPQWKQNRVRDSIHQIAERIRAGASIRSLAREYGVGRETLRRELNRVGITIETTQIAQVVAPPRRVRLHRVPGCGRSLDILPENVPLLLTRHQAGESLRSLARSTGVSHETMRRVLASSTTATGPA